MVVKCGAVMPHSAMNVTCSWHTRSIARRRTMPCEIGEQHDLEQHGGRIRGRARRVAPEPRVEVRQVDFVVEQVIQRVLERARQQLAGEVHRQKLRIRIEGLVAGHGRISTAGRNGNRFDVANTRGRASSSVSTSACRRDLSYNLVRRSNDPMNSGSEFVVHCIGSPV